MYELFLTATVTQSDFEMAAAILQGLTWMTARHTVHRVLNFTGPAQPRGLPKTRTFQPLNPAQQQQVQGGQGQQVSTQGGNQQMLARQFPLWQELGRHLGRASYVLQVSYEVFPETDFGKGAGAEGGGGLGDGQQTTTTTTTMDLNAMLGTLRWVDFPDPLRDSPVTQRKKVEIPDCRNMLVVMNDNNHSYRSEMIQESYSFVRGSVEFVFSRYYHLPGPGRSQSISSSPTQQAPPVQQQPPSSGPAPNLPAWADLRPIDPAQKWILNVKLNVVEDNQPEKMQKATDELMAVRVELEKLFEFKVVDRRVFDTRMAALPVGHGIRVP